MPFGELRLATESTRGCTLISASLFSGHQRPVDLQLHPSRKMLVGWFRLRLLFSDLDFPPSAHISLCLAVVITLSSAAKMKFSRSDLTREKMNVLVHHYYQTAYLCGDVFK